MDTLNTIMWSVGISAPIFYAAGSLHVIGRCWGWAARKLTGKMDEAGLKSDDKE
jgi:hypothetical protein